MKRLYYVLAILALVGLMVSAVGCGSSTPTTTTPTVSTYSPVDNATGVATNFNPVITFSENMAKGTGNIYIKKTSDNSTIDTIGVTSDQVTVSGTTVIIHPTSDLANGEGYYVQIDSTALVDKATTSPNAYAGISDATTWNFTTKQPNAPTYSLANAKMRFKIATTTSLYDTGLWAYLEPMFEKAMQGYTISEGGIPRTGVELDIIYAGTGAAITQAVYGNVDAVVVHDPAQEVKFVSDGYGINKKAFGYNFFMIAGPSADPAGIKDLAAADAFKMIAQAGMANPGSVKFISRGDNSGTHGAEKRLWASAGYDYATQIQGQPWYISTGQGMAPSLVIANEKNAYVLCDGSTFTTLQKNMALVSLVKKNSIESLNIYDVYAVNQYKVLNSDPTKTTNTLVPASAVKLDLAKAFINWLISSEIQKVIGEYGVKEFGGSLFYPIADPAFTIPNFDVTANMQPIP